MLFMKTRTQLPLPRHKQALDETKAAVLCKAQNALVSLAGAVFLISKVIQRTFILLS